MYGVFLGGFNLTLAVFTLDKIRMKHFTRAWGFVQGTKALPFLVGIPVNGYINQAFESAKAGFYFSFVCVVLGALCLFMIGCLKNKSREHSKTCKETSIMTGGSDSAAMAIGLNELVSDGFRPRISNGAVSAGPILTRGPGARTNLACTCGDIHNEDSLILPGIRKLSGDAGSAALLSNPAAAAMILAGQEFITKVDEVIEEDDDDDDDDADDIKTTVFGAAGIKPDLLTCISEENLFENLDVEFFGDSINNDYLTEDNCIFKNTAMVEDPVEENEGLSKRKLLYGQYGQGAVCVSNKLQSFSEPDLLRLFSVSYSPEPNSEQDTDHDDIKNASPNRRGSSLIEKISPFVNLNKSGELNGKSSNKNSNPSLLNRQRTWHHFKTSFGVREKMRTKNKKKKDSKRSNKTAQETVVAASTNLTTPLVPQLTSFV